MCIRIQWITKLIIYGFNRVLSLDVYEPDKLPDLFFMGLIMFWVQTCVDLKRCQIHIFWAQPSTKPRHVWFSQAKCYADPFFWA
jgi:hypothetical protein